MTWHAHSGPRSKDSAKFRSYAKMGTEKATGGQYHGWHYSFVSHQTGGGARRTRYAVSISDKNKNRVEYLRGFSSIEQAVEAAKQCIDQKLGYGLSRQNAGVIGTIPPLPSIPTAQEK